MKIHDRILILFSAAIITVCPLAARAADATWNVDADGNWNNSGNWTAAFPNAAGDDATLGNVITADRTITLGQNITIRTLTTNDDNQYTITGANTLIISLAGTALTQSGAGAVQIDSAVQINNDMTWTGAGTGIVTVNGVISEDGGSTDTLTKTGNFTLVLNGNNTFAGGLTVNGGTVEFGNDGANGTGTLTLTSGTIQAGGGARAINEAVTVNGNITVGGANDLTLSGAMALGGAVRTITVDNAGATTFSGVVSGAGGGITKGGAGTLTLSGAGANTASGATTVNDGTMILNKTAGVNAVAGALAIGDGTGAADSAILQLNAANQIANTSAVSINTDGQFNLNGNSETIGTLTMTGGEVTTGAGTLTLGGNVTGNAAASSATIEGNLALGASRTFTIADGAAADDMVINATVSGATFGINKQGAGKLVLNANNTFSGAMTVTAGTVEFGNDGANGTGTLTLNGGTIQAGGGARVLNEAVTVGGNFTVGGANDLTLSGAMGIGAAARTITVDNTGDTTFSGIISGAGGSIVKAGNGLLILNGNNTYSGGLTINAGTVEFGNDGANGTGTLTLNGGTIQAGGGARVLNEAVTVGGNFTVGGANDLTLSGAMALGAVDRTITVDNTGLTIFTGIISGAGGGIIKEGTGTMRWNQTAANTYTGGLTINNGVIEGNNSVINGFMPDGQTLTIGDGVGAAGSAIMRNIVQGQIGNNAPVVINSDGVFDYNGSGIDTIGALTMTEGSIIGGVGSDMRLTGNVTINASANGSVISVDLLQLVATTRTFTVADGAATDDLLMSGTIASSGVGNIIKAGAGNMTMSGNNTYTGTTTINAGTMTVTSNNALGTTAAGTSVASGATLAFRDNVNYSTTEAVSITGAGVGSEGAILNTSGNNAFAGAVTMTGASTIGSNAGELTLSGNLNNGGFLLTTTGAGDLTLSGVISGAGGLTKNGAGTTTIAGGAVNTFSGAVTINAGTLELNKTGSLNNAGNDVTVNTGGTLLWSGASTDRMNSGADVTLAGGTLTSQDVTETAGVLTLTGNSVINLGTDAGNDDITFANLIDSGGAVTINNWSGKIYASGTDDRIFITGGVVGTIFGDVTFTGFNPGAIILSTGELVPIPEPATVMGGILIAALIGLTWLRSRADLVNKALVLVRIRRRP